jgi:4-amino-4-deoxy-L-arabinose transferase-like glycosyltransferase
MITTLGDAKKIQDSLGFAGADRSRRIDSLIILLASSCISGLLWNDRVAFEADGVSRILISESWLRSPALITSGVWGPLHGYLLAAARALSGSRLIAGLSISVVATVAAALGLYAIGRRANGRLGGWIAAGCWLLNPLALRLSTDAVSEPIQACFVVASLAALLGIQRGRGDSLGRAVWSGMMLTLAAAVRYESWLLIPVFALFIAGRDRKASLVFAVAASSFPIAWSVGNFVAFGDLLHGIHGNSAWLQNAEGFTPGGRGLVLLRKATFLFRAFGLGFGVIQSILLLPALARALRSAGPQRLIAGTFLLLFVVFLSQQTFGFMLTRSRYALILFALGAAVLAGDERIVLALRRQPRNVRALVLAGVCLSATFTPVLTALAPGGRLAREFSPRHEFGADVAELGSLLAAARSEGDGMVFDFWDWTDTYNLMLRASARDSLLFVAPGGASQPLRLDALRAMLCERTHGLLVSVRDSKLDHAIDRDRERMRIGGLALHYAALGQVDAKAVFRYEVLPGQCQGAPPYKRPFQNL